MTAYTAVLALPSRNKRHSQDLLRTANTRLERFIPLQCTGGGARDGLAHGHRVCGGGGGEELLEDLAVEICLGREGEMRSTQTNER